MQDNNLKTGKRPKNPLVKRVFKDLVRDKVRYLMVFAMLVVTVGFVSGMYVANNSMMTTLDENIEKLVREDGHFELSQTADEALKTLIESGEMADVPSVMRTRAYEEVEDKVIETVDEKTLSAVKENVEAIIYAQVEAEVGKQLSKAAAAGIKIPESERERTIKEAFDLQLKKKLTRVSMMNIPKYPNDTAWMMKHFIRLRQSFMPIFLRMMTSRLMGEVSAKSEFSTNAVILISMTFSMAENPSPITRS